MKDLLEISAPDWAIPIGTTEADRTWLVAPPRPGGRPNPALHLRIRVEQGHLVVGESNIGGRLPLHCPELHIMSDATFCIGRRIYAANDEDAVAAFWQELGEFCLNIEFAMKRGRWPIGRWISHGARAADLQSEAEHLAAQLGSSEPYLECVETGTGWLADVVSSERARMRPGSNCPICGRRGEGKARPRCAHRARIEKLARIERARQAAERAYFLALRKAGMRCCGKMPNCQIERRDAA